MVLTLKAKEGLEHDNRFQVGQTGLIGNPAAAQAMDNCDVLFLVGTDFPYTRLVPRRKDRRPARRAAGAHRPAYLGRRALVGRRRRHPACPAAAARRPDGQRAPRAPRRRSTPRGTTASRLCSTPVTTRPWSAGCARVFDNPDDRIRRGCGGGARPARRPDAVFTTDTGMSTVWVSRFVR